MNPETVDAAVDAATVLATKLSVDDDGNLIITLPIADPEVAGALWSDSGVVTVSSGGA